MSDLNVYKPQGMLHEGWASEADDYAIYCGWIHNGMNEGHAGWIRLQE